jgi:hypothetical protein
MNLNTDINNDMQMQERSQIYANRCIAITKNNKKCRAKVNNLKSNYKFFCCESHLPLNKEIIENGCFMCMEKIENLSDIIYFECKHLFHKPCYLEWLTYSTYDKPICLICRNDVIINKDENLILQKYKKIDNQLHKPIINIKNILDKYDNKCNCKECREKSYIDKYVNTSLFCEKLLSNKKIK